MIEINGSLGIQVRGYNINSLRHTDDTILLAENVVTNVGYYSNRVQNKDFN